MYPIGNYSAKTIITGTLIILVVCVLGYYVPYMVVGIFMALYFFSDRETGDIRDTAQAYTHHDNGMMYIPAWMKASYLNSPEWKALRAKRLSLDNHRCTVCNASSKLECHHITYERLTMEKLSDVTTLCRSCHQKIHDRLGYDRATIYRP